jgi:Zn-dependent peptidase ImmA (M78 family)
MSNNPQQLASEILRRGKYTVPVDIHSIAQEHNIAVRTENLEDSVSGILVIKDGSAVIGVNESHHPNRQRFTIAHEIGHFLLHNDKSNIFIDASPTFYRDNKSSLGIESQEIEANMFAASLLMPENELRGLINNQHIDPYDDTAIRRLADQFKVSSQAITIRLIRLGIIAD